MKSSKDTDSPVIESWIAYSWIAVVLLAVFLQLTMSVFTIEIVAGWSSVAALALATLAVLTHFFRAATGRKVVLLRIPAGNAAGIHVLKLAEVGPREGVHPDEAEPPSARAA
jgi:hypothetical protein